MIKGNRIIFGYGSVSVGAFFNSLVFQEIEPPLEIGANVNEYVGRGEAKFIGEKKTIVLYSYEDCKDFDKLLNTVDGENVTEIEYDGLILDFSNYNEKSVEVVKKHLNAAINHFLRLMAC